MPRRWKIPLLLVSLLLVDHSVWTQAPAGYYASAENRTGDALHQALHEIIDDHTVHSYSAAYDFVDVLDEIPGDSTHVMLLYADSVATKASRPGYNREHTWPQSLGALRRPAQSDMHHIFAVDANVNNSRGNKPFDECETGCRIHAEAPEAPYDDDSWEPPNEDKGDIARALFYMDVRYEGDSGEPNLVLTDGPVSPGCDCMGHVSTLLRWHQQDPPDDRERARNNKIFSDIQGNRNPFVDRPEWVCSYLGRTFSTHGHTSAYRRNPCWRRWGCDNRLFVQHPVPG